MSSSQVPAQIPQSGVINMSNTSAAAAASSIPNMNYPTQISGANMSTVPTYTTVPSLPQSTGNILHINILYIICPIIIQFFVEGSFIS